MDIGLSATFLLYGALTAMLVVTVFIIIGMIWLNSRIDTLERVIATELAAISMSFKRLGVDYEDIPRG